MGAMENEAARWPCDHRSFSVETFGSYGGLCSLWFELGDCTLATAKVRFDKKVWMKKVAIKGTTEKTKTKV